MIVDKIVSLKNLYRIKKKQKKKFLDKLYIFWIK